jgi:hypothetical protein
MTQSLKSPASRRRKEPGKYEKLSEARLVQLKVWQHFETSVTLSPASLKILHDHIQLLARRLDEERERNTIWWRDKMRLIISLSGILMALMVGNELAEAALKLF